MSVSEQNVSITVCINVDLTAIYSLSTSARVCSHAGCYMVAVSQRHTKPKGLDMHQVHCQMQISGMVKDACFNIVERMAHLKDLFHLSLAKEIG